MSSYANYDAASKSYDDTRLAIGSEIILGCLASLGKPLSELRVLDAGCGTGAYSQAIIAQVGGIEALDMSPGMLATAARKLAAERREGAIRFSRGAITALPFRAASFDAVMVNQVVHHLGDSAENEFAGLRQAIGEIARVLRKGGGFLLNHCSEQQIRDCHWYSALIPDTAERYRKRFAPHPLVRQILEQAGFAFRGSYVPTDAVCQGEAYFDGTGPLRPEWRRGDSIWDLVGDDELEKALQKIRDLAASGKLDSYVARHDARRADVGQITFLFALRL